MTAGSTHVPIRRILVAFDTSLPSEAAMESAARLAARMEAELLGLFVEDINLLNLAGLPFARESCLSFSLTRRLMTEDMERAMRVRAERARTLVERTAMRQSLRWSFRVVRGRMAEELQLASEQTDVIAFGMPLQVRAVTGAPAIARTVPRPILFLPRGATLEPPFGVVFGRSAASLRALALAARLAGDEGQGVAVILASGDKNQARELENQASQALREDRAAVTRVDRLESLTVPGLLHALGSARLRTLVLPADLDWMAPDALEALLKKTHNAVLLVR
jgi:nucleotide-binding universal stress UspA family protein